MNSNKGAPRTEVKIADIPIKMIVDTGASVNILDSRTYDRIKTAVPLKPTATKVYPYGTDKALPLLGETTMPVESKAKTTVAKFYVHGQRWENTPIELGNSQRTRTHPDNSRRDLR